MAQKQAKNHQVRLYTKQRRVQQQSLQSKLGFLPTNTTLETIARLSKDSDKWTTDQKLKFLKENAGKAAGIRALKGNNKSSDWKERFTQLDYRAFEDPTVSKWLESVIWLTVRDLKDKRRQQVARVFARYLKERSISFKFKELDDFLLLEVDFSKSANLFWPSN